MPRSTRARPGWNRAQAWFATASLGASADVFIRYLTERGYAEGTINSYFGSVAHFLHWLSRQRTGSREISENWINRFLDRHLPHCRCAPNTRRELR